VELQHGLGIGVQRPVSRRHMATFVLGTTDGHMTMNPKSSLCLDVWSARALSGVYPEPVKPPTNPSAIMGFQAMKKLCASRSNHDRLVLVFINLSLILSSHLLYAYIS
jgi:hypothetical protein